MAEETNGSPSDPGEPYPGLNEQVLAAIREAIQAGMANLPYPIPLEAPPPVVSPQMGATPNLQLRLPAPTDLALVGDLNWNFNILDNSVTLDQVATLTNKTLVSPVISNPTITGWTNAQHSHLNAAGAGQLDGAAIVAGDIGTGFLVRESHLTDSIQDIFTSGGQDLVSPDLIDAVVRDTLWWGPVLPGGGAADVSLKRALAGQVTLAGSLRPALGFLSTGHTALARLGSIAADQVRADLTANVWWDGTNWLRDDVAKPAVFVHSTQATPLQVRTVAAGANPVVVAGIQTLLTLDAAGNVGIGVVPKLSQPDWRTLGLGGAGGFRAPASPTTHDMGITENTWNDSGTNRAIEAGFGTTFSQSGGVYRWFTAPSVAKDAAQTFAMLMSLDTNGKLEVVPPPHKQAAYFNNNVVISHNPVHTSPQHNPAVPTDPGNAHPDYRGLWIGYGNGIGQNIAANNHIELLQNAYLHADGSYRNAVGTLGSGRIHILGGSLYYQNAPQVASGAVAVFANRMIIDTSGTMTLASNAGLNSIVANNGVKAHSFYAEGATAGVIFAARNDYGMSWQWYCDNGGAYLYQNSPGIYQGIRVSVNMQGSMTLATSAGYAGLVAQILSGAGGFLEVNGGASGNVHINCPAGVMHPKVDNTTMCGHVSYRWTLVYATNGAIQTSVYGVKEAFAPLDPAACAQAVLETDWVNFRYLPPAYQEPVEEEGQDEEAHQRQVDEARAIHAKLVKDTAPARQQKGYVLQSPVHATHDLFGLEDRESTSVASDLAVVACALQGALQRIAALEGAEAPAPAAAPTPKPATRRTTRRKAA